MAEVDTMNRQWYYGNCSPGGAGAMAGFQTSPQTSGMGHSQSHGHRSRLGGSNTGINQISVNGASCANIMSQINEISEGVYLCGARAIDINRLRDLGISLLVNVTIELPSLLIDKMEYIKIAIEDSPVSNLSTHFDKVADKIDEARRRGGKVLVHCVAGVSRSASLVIAYLMKHKSMSLRRAYLHVKARRPIIRPNPGFFRQLMEYEIRMFGSPTVAMVWNAAAGGQIPDVYEPDYNNTVNFIKKYGAHMDRLGRGCSNGTKCCGRTNSLFR